MDMPTTPQFGHVNFDDLPGFKPAIGGLRHLTDRSEAPAAGEVVEMLCSYLYQVARRNKSPHIYDCSACAEVYRERL